MVKIKDMKTYNEMKKEVDAMPDSPEKKAMKSLLSTIKKTETLQRKYEKMKDTLPEDERKRLAEFFE